MITYYVACSLDGYIAGPDHDLAFLDMALMDKGEDYGYHDFYDPIEVTVMGRGTWEMVKGFGEWPYSGKESWVLTHAKDLKPLADEKFTEFDADVWKKKSETQKIWLVGGGKAAAPFLDAGLVDELIITTIPVTLGAGVTLFAGGYGRAEWRLQETKSYKLGITQATYALKK